MKVLANILGVVFLIIFSPVITILLGIISVVGAPIGLIYSTIRSHDARFQSGSLLPMPISLNRVNAH